MIAWVLVATLALCWAATAIVWKLDERRHTLQLRHLQMDLAQERLENTVNIRDDVRLENLRITHDARVRQLQQDHQAELNRERERTASWQRRCEAINREAKR